MKRLWLLALVAAHATALAGGPVYPNRWVYVARGLHKDADVEDIRQIVATAAAHGLNGLVLAAGLDRLDLQPEHYLRRIDAVKAICAERKVAIIPLIFSVGYGGSVLAHDRHLAAGIPVRDALFVVQGGQARLVPDPPIALVNPGFEDAAGHRLKGYRLQEQPGEVSFVDTEVFHEGRAALRLENFTANPHGHGRVMQELAVRPHRCYRVSYWVKTDGLEPAQAFRAMVLAGDRALAPWDPHVPATADWRRVTFGFNSFDCQTVRLYLGVWGGRKGRFWVDDLRVEEVGLLNVLRRPGTPVAVRGEANGTVYEEGRDYAPIADPKLTFRFDHEPPPVTLPPGSRIQQGERLRVSYYHGIAINDGQVSVCMSEPKLYDLFRTQARLLQQRLAPRHYLLSMDEVRAGGSCQACQSRKMAMGEILGDCLTKQFQILHEASPQAEVFTWSDMLDPHHNAHGNYYLVEGDFTGSWRHVPKELGIVCWHYAKRRESLAHFSGLGFRTLAGAYYDGDTLDNPRGWLDALDRTPNAVGIMYTTWQNQYRLLAPFGDLVSRR